jgi:inorganic pyrophosphatase
MQKIFWETLDALINSTTIIIDRPKGSAHPRYPDLIYPADYGYLEDTHSIDGGGVDAWRGSQEEPILGAIIVTVDLLKRDVEIKLLVGCTHDEKDRILRFHNDSSYIKGILIPRE